MGQHTWLLRSAITLRITLMTVTTPRTEVLNRLSLGPQTWALVWTMPPHVENGAGARSSLTGPNMTSTISLQPLDRRKRAEYLFPSIQVGDWPVTRPRFNLW